MDDFDGDEEDAPRRGIGMRLFGDIGWAIQDALWSQNDRDRDRYGLWPRIMDLMPVMRVRRGPVLYEIPPSLGAPDVVIFDDPPLDIRDIAD